MAKKKHKKSKPVAKAASVIDTITSDVIAAVCHSATPPLMPVFLKVCRLCQSKDGPFLNIFDSDKVTAKKIEDLMPFSITENDDLPHKICFRCSAKLEELHEFIQKCIKTQENLHNALGKTGPLITKSKVKTKKLWEEKLNKSNMSNDDICDALIKKAMEGIKGIPVAPPKVIIEEETKRTTRSREHAAAKEIKTEPLENAEAPPSQTKLVEKLKSKPPSTKNTRSSKQSLAEAEGSKTQASVEKVENEKPGASKSQKSVTNKQETIDSSKQNDESTVPQKVNTTTLNNLSFDVPATTKSKSPEKKEPEKPFNIMDYISMIKVNGVGILFQCKLCNRNFLKLDVVESHSCAKNRIPKLDPPKSVPVPDPPKVPSVKYIKIDNDMKKSLTEKVKLAEKSEMENTINLDDKLEKNEAPPKIKPKPKAGPASKTKHLAVLDPSASQANDTPTGNSPTVQAPSVHFPTMPNLNSRFKLVPGPNNIFSLVEDTSVSVPDIALPTPSNPPQDTKKSSRKRKIETEVPPKEVNIEKSDSPEIIDLEDQSQPYPVGLFQTVGHSQATPPSFTTPAMKKQSYTVVQTGNPSKLLISAKAKAADSEAPKKRQKKAQSDTNESTSPQQPFRVTLEDVAHPKDTGFFTFINVDPLLQPSYVLPTDNIIQESQISTSSAVVRENTESDSKDKEKYGCNMCGEKFSREKKLLAHIQSHYTQMDAEDQKRAEQAVKRKSKK